MKIIKKWDIVIIVLLLVISIVPYLIFAKYQKNYSGEIYAVVYTDGAEKQRIRLDNNSGEKKFTIKSGKGYNNVVIKDNSIAITEADCSDKVCTEFGFVHKVGDKIVCLPNKVVIEIQGNKIEEGQEDFISR